MGKNMELLGLNAVILSLIMVCCKSELESLTLSYYKYTIGDSVSKDTIEMLKKGDIFTINDREVNITFSVLKNTLSVYSRNCNDSMVLSLNVGESSKWACNSIFPIFGEKISLLDTKSFTSDGKEYKVFKVFNHEGNSYLNSTTTFWLEDNTLLLISLGEGEYMELEGYNSRLVNLVKKDLSFSGLFPIPPLPPPPPIIDEEE